MAPALLESADPPFSGRALTSFLHVRDSALPPPPGLLSSASFGGSVFLDVRREKGNAHHGSDRSHVGAHVSLSIKEIIRAPWKFFP